MRLTASMLAAVLVVAGLLIGQRPAGEAGTAPKVEAEKTAAPATPASAPAAANKDKKAWPVAFAETAAPATKADGKGFTFSTLVTNASASPQAITASAFVRDAAGAPATVSVTCATQPAQAATVSSPGGTQAPAAGSTQTPAAGGPQPPAPKPSSSCDVTLAPGATLLILHVQVPGSREAYPLSGVATLAPKPSPPAGTWTEEQPLAKLALPAIQIEDASSIDWQIVRAAGLCAVVAVLLAAVLCAVLWWPTVWFQRMGAAEFKFSESWSSALMIGGPLLTGLLTTYTGFPENPHAISKKGYLFMSLLLTAIIALGPAIYTLIRVPTETTDKDGKPITENQGIVLGFFVAAAVALTGGLAQLGLLGTLFGDLANARIISTEFGTALTAATKGLFWLILAGSVVSMVFTVAVFADPTEKPETGPVAKVAAKMESSVQASPAGGAGPKRLPSWSLP
jgi:hypothetical protein